MCTCMYPYLCIHVHLIYAHEVMDVCLCILCLTSDANQSEGRPRATAKREGRGPYHDCTVVTPPIACIQCTQFD